MLNDTISSQTPYFWSAAHCISTQTVANSLNTYWFYEADGCSNSSKLNPNYYQLAGGATLLHANLNTDTLLLRLNNKPMAGGWFAGWDATLFSSGDMIGIHHPIGDHKKVSTGKGEGRSCVAYTFSGTSIWTSDLSLTSWTEGSDEGGSSGSGLFTLSNGNYYLRGGLTGGNASCSSSGKPVEQSNASCYSSLNLVFYEIEQYLALAPPPPPGPTRQYTGQWISDWVTNPENSWGLTVLMNFSSNARYLFVPWYTYDSNGKASWYLFQGNGDEEDGKWTANDTFTTNVYRYTGPNWGYFDYTTNTVHDNKVGTATLTFTSATAATFTYNVENSSRTVNLSKWDGDYGMGQYSGQWANNDEYGWGLTVLQSFSNPNYIFVPWYTYDANGKASWYIFQGEGTQIDANTYQLSPDLTSSTYPNNVCLYSGPKWGALPYDNSQTEDDSTCARVGTATLTFTSSTTASFSYSVDGVSRAIPLVKLQ
ncbi:MAG: hypothetical protein LBB65_00545 [Burkholderiales bacterium]|nr:hypothetical protein [Burkholderiales bacterium]